MKEEQDAYVDDELRLETAASIFTPAEAMADDTSDLKNKQFSIEIRGSLSPRLQEYRKLKRS